MAILPDDIRAILETDIEDSSLNAYIKGATELVKSAIGATMPEALRDEIIRWLAAHLIASTREQQLQSAKAGSAEAVFQGITGLGLDSTQYGQQAKALDFTGGLAALGKVPAKLWAIGSFK